MSSGESQEEDLQKQSLRAERAGSSKKKGGLDNLHDGFFEESSTTSEEEDEMDFKADPLEFSSSESDDEKNSDMELKTSDEEQLLNMYDKKLRDQLSSKNVSKVERGDHDKISRITEFMKKIRSDEKNKLTDSKAYVEEAPKNRRNKETNSKKFDYKDRLQKQMKNQNVVNRYDSTESATESGSDSELDDLADSMANMNTGMSPGRHSTKAKPDMARVGKAASSKEMDIRKKIAEMKKMVGTPKSPDHIDEQLLKAKQRVTDWMKEEDAKTAALKDKFSASGKFPVDTLMKEISGRKPVKLPKVGNAQKLFDARNPLPPVKTKKPLGAAPIRSIKKEDVLQILRDVDPSASAKTKHQRVGLEKSTDALRKSLAAAKMNSALPAKLQQSRSDSNKISSKTDPTQLSTRSTTKLTEKKSSLKKPILKRTGAS